MDKEEEALRLKTRAEEKLKLSSLRSALKYAKRAERLCPKLDGISEMVTAFRILRVASKPSRSAADATPEWYKILQVEPFSHINTIKKQYKKLALILHPDKNSCVGSEEAFKHVGEAFRFLSDRIRRKEYDMKLRIALESRAKEAARDSIDTFWTACTTCRLLHKFERRYLGHNLLCPRCKKSFLAVEVRTSDSIDSDDDVSVRIRTRTRARGMVSLDSKRDSKLVEEGKDSDLNNEEGVKVGGRARAPASSKEKRDSSLPVNGWVSDLSSDDLIAEVIDARVRAKARARVTLKKNRGSSVVSSGMVNIEERVRSGSLLGKSPSKKVNIRHEKTLAEMQLEAKRKSDLAKSKKITAKDKVSNEEKEKTLVSRRTDLACMTVEDSDFYDFDKGRMERCFKKGQVWAVYDDDDGMPRHYGLIDEIVSTNPFMLKMSWLDWQHNKDEALICWEKSGFHISCGRFKIGRKIDINSVNLFSHIVDCERAAREIYRIYPKKGSIWALYRGENLDGNNGNTSNRRCYDLAVFLTSYSEMHGLSFAYLEKLDGFKTVFKRRESGCHAIKWLEKDDARLFSHHIPARRLSGEEAMDIPKDCWELDPASLPSDLVRICWER